MSSWVTLLEETTSFDQWLYTPVNNTANTFRFSHNFVGDDKNAIAILEQADQDLTTTVFDVKRFFLESEDRVLTFNKPVFFNNRAIGILLLYTGSSTIQSNITIKVEYYVPDTVPPNANQDQIDRLERKVDMLVNQYLIKHYLLSLEDSQLEVYQLNIEE